MDRDDFLGMVLYAALLFLVLFSAFFVVFDLRGQVCTTSVTTTQVGSGTPQVTTKKVCQ